MTDAAGPDSSADDAAAVGFALLMAGVETAVAAAAHEIATLGQVVQQGFSGLPAVTPPALPALVTRPASAVGLSEVSPRPVLRPAPELPPVTPKASTAQSPSAVAPTSATAVSAPMFATSTAAVERPSLPQTAPDDQLGHASPSSGAVAQRALAESATASPSRIAASLAPSTPARAAGPSGWPEAPVATVAGVEGLSTPTAPSTLPEASLAQQGPGTAAAEPSQGVPFAPAQREAVGTTTATPAYASMAPITGNDRSLAPVARESGQSASPDGAGGPTHGDVFLDGTRLGHWVSETLARAAGAPARTTTGFDPRMGPRWPGTLQGR